MTVLAEVKALPSYTANGEVRVLMHVYVVSRLFQCLSTVGHCRCLAWLHCQCLSHNSPLLVWKVILLVSECILHTLQLYEYMWMHTQVTKWTLDCSAVSHKEPSTVQTRELECTEAVLAVSHKEPSTAQTRELECTEAVLPEVLEQNNTSDVNGRADSPDHSAKFGSYTVIDMTLNSHWFQVGPGKVPREIYYCSILLIFF